MQVCKLLLVSKPNNAVSLNQCFYYTHVVYNT
jgi:hypothetical protein